MGHQPRLRCALEFQDHKLGVLSEPQSGESLSAFRVKAHQWWEGETFLPYLMAPVINDCWQQCAKLGATDPKAVPILVNIAPRDRPGASGELGEIVLDRLPGLIGRPWPDGSAVFALGRVGAPYLLAEASKLGARLAILVGAESFLRQDVIDQYVRRGRVLSQSNSSGFIAGEAAAALVISPGSHAQGLAIIGMGLGQEPAGEGGTKDAPVMAKGLTDAMRMSLSAARTEFFDVNLSMGDLNGEHFKFKEHAFAAMRLDRVPAGRSFPAPAWASRALEHCRDDRRSRCRPYARRDRLGLRGGPIRLSSWSGDLLGRRG